MNTVLKLENLSCGRKSAVVRNISCTVESNTLVILSGKNGSGKSTLLKTIAGILPALGGDIFLGQKSLSSMSRHDIACMLSYAGTERVSEDYITVEDLVRFGRFPYDINRNSQEREFAVSEAIQRMDIDGIKDKYLNTISDGEWQKANLARVLAQNTPLIVLDEPSAFLDYPSRIQLFGDLKKICGTAHKTIILSTHDIDIANRYADIFWHIEGEHFTSSRNAPEWKF